MSEQADFILKLNDQVSGPAKAAADALRRVEDKAKSAADKGMAKLEAATRRMGLAQVAAAKMNAQFDQQRQKASEKALAAAQKQAALGKSNSFLGGFGQKLGFRSVADYAKGAFIGDLAAKGVETIIGGFVTGAKMAVSLVTSGVKMAFSEGSKAEDLRLSYKHLLGDKGGRDALGSIGGFADRTKFDDDKIAEMMRPLFRAGMSGVGARTAFALAGDANVRTGEDPSETIAGLAKIYLKGGVTEKLIVGLGVSVREFKDALAVETKSKDKDSTFKKATEGKLDPVSIQNAIVRATEKHFGTKTGTATNEAADTMSTHLEKLSDLPSQYLKKMSDPSNPAWAALSKTLGDALQGLSPEGPRGQKIIASLFRVFGQISKFVTNALTPENIDKFAAGVSKVVDGLAALPGILGGIITASEIIGAIWAGSALVSGVTALAGVLPVLGTGLGAIAGTVTLISAPFIVATAAVASLGVAVYEVVKSVRELGGVTSVLNDLKDWASNADPAVSKGNPGFAAMQEENARNLALAHGGPPVARAGGGSPVSLSFTGDINMTAPTDGDPKEAAATFHKEVKRLMSNDLENQAMQSGGAS